MTTPPSGGHSPADMGGLVAPAPTTESRMRSPGCAGLSLVRILPKGSTGNPASMLRSSFDRYSSPPGFLSLFSLLLPVAAVSAMIGGSWARLAIFGIALLAYSAFWFVLAVVISLRTTSVAPGFVIGSCSWLLLVA